jgi:hypothetical protein
MGNEKELCLLNIQSQIDFLFETTILGILAKRVHNECTNAKRTARWMFSSVCGGGCVTLNNFFASLWHLTCKFHQFEEPPYVSSTSFPLN